MKKISLLTLVLLVGFQSFALHPLKLSVVDITHKDKKLQVKFKLFVEDMDAVMGQYTKKPFTLVKFADKEIDNSLVSKKIRNFLEQNDPEFAAKNFGKNPESAAQKHPNKLRRVHK